MKKETKTVTVYRVGEKEFFDEKEALEYEKEINKQLGYVYFTVSCKPDLTEGRGYRRRFSIAVPNVGTCKEIAMSYCEKELGSSLAFVQGVSPIANWKLDEGKVFKTIEELNKFRDQKVSEGIGDYSKLVKRVIKYLDMRGKEIK